MPPDCATCRATGATAFAGIAVYLLHVRQTALSLSHSRLLLALSAASAAAAVARWRAE
jgi:hypothetical protein